MRNGRRRWRDNGSVATNFSRCWAQVEWAESGVPRTLSSTVEVAIKILPGHLAQDAEALARFKAEARAVAALSHANILAIYDFGTEQGVTFAVMKLLAGETLRGRLARSALGWRKAAEYGVTLADGLAAAH